MIQPADEVTDWSTAYLLARLELVRAQVEAVVAAHRLVDPKPDDPYRGVYTDDRDIDWLLKQDGRPPRRPPPDAGMRAARGALAEKAAALYEAGTTLRLDEVAEAFGLEPFDVDLLMVGMAPDLDPSFEKLYGYLNDDVTRRRASVGLALELCGASVTDGWARRRLANPAPLIAGGLASVEDTERPLLGRSLRVPDRVVDHLLGQDEPDPLLAPLLVRPGPWPGEVAATVNRALDGGVKLFYVQERPGSAGLSYLAAGFHAAGRDVVAIDLTLLGGSEDDRVPAVGAREARLRGAALVVTHVDAVSDRGPIEVRRWAETPGLVALTGSHPWDPRWSSRPPLVLEVPSLADDQRVSSWAAALGRAAPETHLSRAVGAYRLTPEQVRSAADGAVQRATARGATVDAEDLQAGRGPRTPPGWKSWPGAFRPEPHGRTWCCPVRSRASCAPSLAGYASRARSSTIGGWVRVRAGAMA